MKRKTSKLIVGVTTKRRKTMKRMKTTMMTTIIVFQICPYIIGKKMRPLVDLVVYVHQKKLLYSMNKDTL